MMAYCTEQTGVTVSINTLQHEDYQNTFSRRSRPTPDDILTWFAGYRMRFFADQGLFSPDRRASGMRSAATTSDGTQGCLNGQRWRAVLRARLQLPVGRHVSAQSSSTRRARPFLRPWRSSRRSVTSARRRAHPPRLWPTQDGWPAMGTFDILNMRMNGYDFHVGLMEGREKWTDPRVKTVFETWRTATCPTRRKAPPDALAGCGQGCPGRQDRGYVLPGHLRR